MLPSFTFSIALTCRNASNGMGFMGVLDIDTRTYSLGPISRNSYLQLLPVVNVRLGSAIDFRNSERLLSTTNGESECFTPVIRSTFARCS